MGEGRAGGERRKERLVVRGGREGGRGKKEGEISGQRREGAAREEKRTE